MTAETAETTTDVEVLDAARLAAEHAAAESRARQTQAIEAVAAHGLETPGMSGRDEFVNLCMQAKLLSMSVAVPKGLRDNPPLCLHLVMLARDLGMSPATAINVIDFIPEDKDNPSKGGQLALKPQAKQARIADRGLGRVELLERDHSYAVAVALSPGGYIERDPDTRAVTRVVGEIGRTEFTWEQAKIAGLVDTECVDGMHHWKKPGTPGKKYEDRCRCRQGYRTYPQRMMGWRAVGYACDDWFPGAGLGMYSADELGATVDQDGRVITPDTVDLPDGYAAPAPETPDEIATRLGWLSAQAVVDADKEIAAELGRYVQAGRMDREEGLGLLKEYRQVSDDRPRGQWRALADHDRWVKARLAAVRRQAGADPETGEIAPESPPEPGPAPTAPVAASGPETGPQAAGEDVDDEPGGDPNLRAQDERGMGVHDEGYARARLRAAPSERTGLGVDPRDQGPDDDSQASDRDESQAELVRRVAVEGGFIPPAETIPVGPERVVVDPRGQAALDEFDEAIGYVAPGAHGRDNTPAGSPEQSEPDPGTASYFRAAFIDELTDEEMTRPLPATNGHADGEADHLYLAEGAAALEEAVDGWHMKKVDGMLLKRDVRPAGLRAPYRRYLLWRLTMDAHPEVG